VTAETRIGWQKETKRPQPEEQRNGMEDFETQDRFTYLLLLFCR
jgi:hypothetical protein